MCDRKDLKASFLISIVSFVLLTLVDSRNLSFQLESYGDSSTLYIFGNTLDVLSKSYPWWTLFEYLIRMVDISSYGFIINLFNVYLGLLVPLSMYFLLKEFRMNMPARIFGSLLYLGNPIILHHFGILDWTFLLSLPLSLLFLIKYTYTRRITWLFWLLIALELPIQLDWVNGGIATLRFLVPGLGLFLLASLFFKNLKITKSAIDYAIVFSVFLLLNSLIIYTTFFGFNSYSYVQSVGSSTSSQFYIYHISNVTYTYSGQNIINSIAGFMMYKGSTLYELGYASTYWILTLLWFTAILASVVCAFKNRGKYGFLFKMAAFSLLLIAVFQIGVYYHLFLFLFREFPFLFVYENPSFLDRPQAFLETILLASMINVVINALREENLTLSASLKRVKKTIIGKGRFFALFDAIILIILLLVVSSAPIYENAVSSSSSSHESKYYIPQYYDQVGQFFNGKLNESRVLILPLNFTTYSHALSIIPSRHLFYVSAGNVNNNGVGPTNETVLQSVFSAILARNASDISIILSEANIKYILITNSIFDKMSVAGNYINGNMSEFSSAFSDPLLFTYIVKNDNFEIVKNNNYSSPVFNNLPSVYQNYPSKTGLVTKYHDLLLNSTFVGNKAFLGKLWHSWSDEPTPNNIVFGINNVTLHVNGTESTIGGLPPASQIWQEVQVYPGEALSFSISYSNFSRVSILPFLTFDNLSEKGHLYPKIQQYYNWTAGIFNGSFVSNLTVPASIYYINAGILVHNLTKSDGSIVITDIELRNMYTASGLMLPNKNNGISKPLPSNISLAGFLPKSYMISLSDSIDNTNLSGISYAPSYGLYLSNKSIAISIRPSNFSINSIGIEIVPVVGFIGHSVITLDNVSYAGTENFHRRLPEYINPSDGNWLNFTIKVDGTLLVKTVYLYNSSIDSTNITVTEEQSSFSISSTNNGNFVLETVEVPSIESGNLSVIKYDGVYYMFGNITDNQTITITFSYLDDINYEIITYNTLVFVSLVSITAVLVWAHQKEKRRKNSHMRE